MIVGLYFIVVMVFLYGGGRDCRFNTTKAAGLITNTLDCFKGIKLVSVVNKID